MSRRASVSILGVLLWAGASPALADDYVVQIGALAQPSDEFAEPARAIGEVRTSLNKDGLTRYRVGVYPDASEAEAVRARLRAAGYEDAFVLLSRRSAKALPAVASPPPARDPLAGLPEEVRGRVVILDGVLHVKDDERFTPLSEYRTRDEAR